MNRVLFVNLLIALAPNVHFLRILHKLVAEIRVGDADQRLRTLPGGQALQVDHAVFRDDVMYTGPGVGVGTMRLFMLPSLPVTVEDMQIKLLPPLDRYAPITKSSCPPVPEMCLSPADSALT